MIRGVFSAYFLGEYQNNGKKLLTMFSLLVIITIKKDARLGRKQTDKKCDFPVGGVLFGAEQTEFF